MRVVSQADSSQPGALRQSVPHSTLMRCSVLVSKSLPISSLGVVCIQIRAAAMARSMAVRQRTGLQTLKATRRTAGRQPLPYTATLPTASKSGICWSLCRYISGILVVLLRSNTMHRRKALGLSVERPATAASRLARGGLTLSSSFAPCCGWCGAAEGVHSSVRQPRLFCSTTSS